MTGPVFLDTNVLVYLFDSGAPAKRQRAREILESETHEGHVLLSTQVLQEFYVAVTRKLSKPLDEKSAERAVHHLASLPIVQVDTPMVLAAIARSRRDHFSFWDALIVESAVVGRANRIYSEDLQHGRVTDGVRIENPFSKK